MTHADTHRAQRVAPASAVQLIHGRGHQAGATGSQRVAQGNSTPVGIDARIIVRQAKGTQHRQALRSEGFVEFDHIHLRQTQARQLQHLACGRCRAKSHERQMLAVGRSLMSRPSLLMLDEPSLGLAPLVVREIFSIITALRKTGVTIVLVEQNARAALAVADHGYVLEMGEVSAQGPAADLAEDPRVIATYLGAARKAA